MTSSPDPRGTPSVHPSAHVAAGAVIVGNVTIGPESVICHGAVLIAETGSINLGRNCIVMEHSVLRASAHDNCTIGSNVMIGPHCHLSGCRIDDEVFVATGVSVFNGAWVRAGSELRINAVVHVGTHLGIDSTLPIGWIAVGNPAQFFSPDRHEEIWAVQKGMDFPGKVFGVSRDGPSPDSMTKRMTDRYSKFLLRQRG